MGRRGGTLLSGLTASCCTSPARPRRRSAVHGRRSGPAAPGTPEWDETWGTGVPISAEEFEAIYAEADATLPWTWGGTPTWVSCVVPVLAIVVVALLLMWWGGTFTG